MKAIVRSSLTAIDCNPISLETFEEIIETGDFEAGILNEYGDIDSAIECSFTPNSLYCKTGATLADVTISENEKHEMFKVVIGDKEIDLHNANVVIVPIDVDESMPTDEIKTASMTTIKEIEEMAKTNAMYAEILDGCNTIIGHEKTCLESLSGGMQMFYDIGEYKVGDFISHFSEIKINAPNLDPSKFTFVFFVTANAVPMCKDFVNDIGDDGDFDKFSYGLYFWDCFFEEKSSPYTIIVEAEPNSIQAVVDYDNGDEPVYVIID